MLNLNTVIDCLKQVLAYEDKAIALHEPNFSGNEWCYIKECLDTGWVSSVGKFVDRFEQDLADYTGAKHAIATVNGTAALHICYRLAGIMPGDEVLVPTLTFVGTVNPITYCGAIPHFIDADENHLGIDADRLDEYLNTISKTVDGICVNRNTQRPIRALCVVHVLGHPVDLDALLTICEKYHIVLIEDAAEALGSFYKGVHVGHRGLLGALSFNGNKIITTGGGGAILTDDPQLGKRAKHLTTTAKLPHAWMFVHDEVGYNYRLPNINAAMGCAQLETIQQRLTLKRMLFERYLEAMQTLHGIRLIAEPGFAKSNYWLNACVLDDAHKGLKDTLLTALNEMRIHVRPLWNLQHSLPMYRDCPRMELLIAERLIERLIKLPSSPQLLK